MNIPVGLCQCGCGAKTNPVVHTSVRHGRKKGEPYRFLVGHNNRLPGIMRRHSEGYVLVLCAGRGRTYQHVLLAEKALGKPLPSKAEVHHVNGDKADNSRGNLVICQDRAYHHLLHCRAKALAACGNANWIRCDFCRQWDAPATMWQHPTRRMAHHPACGRENRKRYRRPRS